MKYLDNLFAASSVTRTENGAKTYDRSGSYLLDFYAQAGAMRKNPNNALELFKKAYGQDKLIAIRILFYLRDVRGGQGERDLFRICLEWIGTNDIVIFEKITQYVSEYGRWDDLFFENDKAVSIILEQLVQDESTEKPTLLAKWLPSITASSEKTRKKAKYFATKFGWSDKKYRQTLSKIRKVLDVVERKMSANKWGDIDFSKVPSQAARIYKEAFKRHEVTKYEEFIEKVEKGEAKINAGTLYPYQIYNDVMKGNGGDRTSNVLWSALPDYTQGKNALVVADVSGSMSGDPMSVSVSLALYFAERNNGYFKDHFLTFSGNPKLQRVTGATLVDKMRMIQRADWEMNTDLERTFKLIVDTAVANNVPAEELPETIYIISDMEFDRCTGDMSGMEMIRDRYKNAGYKVPNIVFWNVNARQDNLPVQHNEYGVALVSGFSPSIFRLAVENKTPEQVMMETINSERYSKIIL